MKRKNFKIYVPIGVALIGLVFACNKSFLEKQPIGSYSPDVIASNSGVKGLLIGAYSLLDGWGGAGKSDPNNVGAWGTAASNWVFGGVCADDAHKGSDPGDQTPIVGLMTWTESPTNVFLEAEWQGNYDGVQRSNEVIREMRLATDIAPVDSVQYTAESRFLRAYFMMNLKKIFGNVPYIDESVTYTLGNWRIPNDPTIAANDASVWPKIEADLQYGVTNLPGKSTDAGRANKYAAEAYLAKAFMFEHKYSDALPLLQDLINNGMTAGGIKYGLNDHFYDNFNADTKNSKESVFAVQSTVNDGSGAANANDGDVLNFDYKAGYIGCCGFDQPSYSLVNAYKTDAVTGYPMPDTYNNSNFHNDEGITDAQPFTPDAVQTLDPRLDWTVGRRGIPYLDWGNMLGASMTRNQASGGPYLPIKNLVRKEQTDPNAANTAVDKSSWTNGYTALNVNLVRFSDVLLWAAECEVEANAPAAAQDLVNIVRTRAANPAGFVHTYIDPATPSLGYTNTPAANYFIKPYAAGFFAGLSQDDQRKYVRFERRLELAMEGHRFFDLVRYGTAAAELNFYVSKEAAVFGYTLMNGASFAAGKAEYFAIPQAEIDVSTIGGAPTLTQNPGYSN